MLVAYAGKYANRIIERQDKRVVITQKPKASAYFHMKSCCPVTADYSVP
jgi:hypothetical protein